jgi:hypothetical protein
MKYWLEEVWRTRGTATRHGTREMQDANPENAGLIDT